MLVMAAEKCKPLDLTSHKRSSAKSASATHSSLKSATHTDKGTGLTAESEQQPEGEQQAESDQQARTASHEQSQSQRLVCAHGTHVYKVKMYHDTLMKTAQKLADAAKITLRLEISGEQMKMYSLL